MNRSVATKRSSWPRWARRGLMENIATAIIAIGFLMLFQPFALSLYTYSFVTMLTGTVMFIIVSKFPE
ncbi:hypothetical protein [Mesorhizobium sp. B2-6-2]|uniref:hypothetical protein n=1 Tax=Mesorhizobium sp. B2-6-2 TaxID=2589915 RepID=UPI001129FF3B|nr:hypothetical protein [Mesorhizobium sp. B2-6-2]TPJ82719.1 hypothetical protein FJ419_02785 [Mesorhizobium sp. B2-6-2]